MSGSLNPHRVFATFLNIIALMPGSASADSDTSVQIRNGSIRIMAAQEICSRWKPMHDQAEVSFRLGYFDDWKRIYSMRLLEAGAKIEQLNDFLRYFDGIFVNGAVAFDAEVCQAFVYSGFGKDYWEEDLSEIIPFDSTSAAYLEDPSMQDYIKSEERKLCELAEGFWQRSCPIFEY